MFSCYTTVYTYYIFIVFTEATYLMTDDPPHWELLDDYESPYDCRRNISEVSFPYMGIIMRHRMCKAAKLVEV